MFEFLDIYEIVITSYYLWSVSTVCSTLLVIHLETDNMNLTSLISELLCMAYAFGQMFLFCEMGENLNNQFSRVSDAIYSSSWYMFPRDLQRIIPTVMMAAQRPVTLQGFANLRCTRQAFKKVFFLFAFYFNNKRFYVFYRSFKVDFHIL